MELGIVRNLTKIVNMGKYINAKKIIVIKNIFQNFFSSDYFFMKLIDESTLQGFYIFRRRNVLITIFWKENVEIILKTVSVD